MDAMVRTLLKCFAAIKDMTPGDPRIKLKDVLMYAFAMMALKNPSLPAFEQRKSVAEQNLKTVFHIENIPGATQMRTRLDLIDPKCLRPAFKTLFSKAQRGKALEPMVFLDGSYLIALDGTGYFSSEKLFSPFCLVWSCSKSGKITDHLQALAAAIVHPDSKTVIPLAPEPIAKQDGATKNDCERHAARRWLKNFREDHPHLKGIITADALSPNAPHIRDIQAAGAHFILGVKEDDHKFLFRRVDAAVEAQTAIEHDQSDPKNPNMRHFFRFTNGIPLNESRG